MLFKGQPRSKRRRGAIVRIVTSRSDGTARIGWFRHGRARRDDLFTVIAAPSGLDHARLGLAVSRKAAKLATQRNRVKRLVRQAFRTAACRLPPVDIVVIARPGIASRSNGDIQRSINAHWKRLGRQCAKSPTP